MSYDILEAVRQTLVDDDGVGTLIEDRIYPEDTKLREKDDAGKFPAVSLAMLNEVEDSCGRINGTVQLDAIHKGNDKKTLWQIHRACELALKPRTIQAAIEGHLDEDDNADPLPIKVALFRQTSVDDTVYDEKTDTWRIRSTWEVKFVRVVLA